MPGYLSQMFDPAGGGDSYDSQHQLGVADDADVHQEVGLQTDFSASYQDPNGTTHSYETSHDISADVGVQATLAVAVDTADHLTSGY